MTNVPMDRIKMWKGIRCIRNCVVYYWTVELKFSLQEFSIGQQVIFSLILFYYSINIWILFFFIGLSKVNEFRARISTFSRKNIIITLITFKILIIITTRMATRHFRLYKNIKLEYNIRPAIKSRSGTVNPQPAEKKNPAF